MKRLFAALALTVLVLGASLFEFIYVGSRSDNYTARIETVDRLLRDGKTADAVHACRSIERDWDRDVEHIYTLLIHDYADNIGNSISKMRVHLEHGNRDMYYAESAGAKKGLASIKGSEYPVFENIL